VVGFLYGIFYIVNDFDTKKLNEKGADFEIKKAHDIKQRLDDVKGIDEIRSEIKDLIKMIKNPD
jgi:ATP-dependent metalloprotease